MSGRKPGKGPAKIMDRVYVHNLDCAWKREDNGTVVIEKKQKRFLSSLAREGEVRDKISHILLDQNAGVLWEAIDGKKSVRDILSMMEEVFPQQEDLSESTVAFFSRMEKEGFIFHRL